jgi:hypothetical protein
MNDNDVPILNDYSATVDLWPELGRGQSSPVCDATVSRHEREPDRRRWMPTLEQLRDLTGERFMDLSPQQIAALFRPTRREEDVALFRDGYPWGSRRGLINLFTLLSNFHDPSPVFAHLCAEVWMEGKERSALFEFRLHEQDILPHDLVAVMHTFRCSGVIMSAKDLAAFDALPETFTVWRGGAGERSELKLGNSWSAQRDVADSFARRAAKFFGHAPQVVWRRVRKDQVVAYFTEREEAEVVLWPRRDAVTRASRARRPRVRR